MLTIEIVRHNVLVSILQKKHITPTSVNLNFLVTNVINYSISMLNNFFMSTKTNSKRARNYSLNRNGNSANFFSYVCNNRKIKELFASTLNRIAVSVRCGSSIIVVLNAKLTRLIAAHANKKDSEKRRSPTRVPFFC